MRYLRHALRTSLAQPGFSVITVLTIALTIGAATAVFSLFDAVLLRPFPYPDPNRLVRIESFVTGDRGSSSGVSYYDFDDFRKQSKSLRHMAAYTSWSNPLTGAGPARSVRMTFVSAAIFDLLGVRPVAGRTFTHDEDVPGGAVLKAVISHGLWQDLFQSSPDALGRSLQLRGQSYEVVGVMPQGFAFPDRSQVWVPLMARYSSYSNSWWQRRDARAHQVIARLADGATEGQANTEISAIAARIREAHPDENRDVDGRVVSLRDAEAGEVKPYVHLVAGAALLLLLLGCLNVANLMIARSVSRERETAIRLALGSGAWSLILQQLAESLVLGTAGAAAGVMLAWIGVKQFLSLLPAQVPAWMHLDLDGRVLAFSVAATVVTSIAAMVLPALHQLRADAGEALKQGARGSTAGNTAAARIRRGLVVGEIALSLVLLAGAGLMIRSFQSAMNTENGIQSENVLVVASGRFVPNVAGEAAQRAYCDVYRKVQLALEETPGVVRASGGHSIPFLGSSERRAQSELYTLRRATRDHAFQLPFAGADIMPGYFTTLGIPILEGRDFHENDKAGGAPVIIVSRQTAEALFPGERAVGQKVRFGINEEYDPWSTIIGVVGNVRFNAAERDPGYEVYWSYRQYPGPGISFLIRTAADPSVMIPEIRRTIQGTNADISIERAAPMEALVVESIWRRRLWGVILGTFAALALALALVGLYGVMSYLVAQQRKEIGIRMAIGAQRGVVVGWVLRRGLTLALIGLAAGLALASAASRLLGDLLFGVSKYDPAAFAAASLALLGTSIAATAIPAIRASRTDPMIALRQE